MEYKLDQFSAVIRSVVSFDTPSPGPPSGGPPSPKGREAGGEGAGAEGRTHAKLIMSSCIASFSNYAHKPHLALTRSLPRRRARVRARARARNTLPYF